MLFMAQKKSRLGTGDDTQQDANNFLLAEKRDGKIHREMRSTSLV
jgi:hypothetical protein